jgi:hypothetical protein
MKKRIKKDQVQKLRLNSGTIFLRQPQKQEGRRPVQKEIKAGEVFEGTLEAHIEDIRSGRITPMYVIEAQEKIEAKKKEITKSMNADLENSEEEYTEEDLSKLKVHELKELAEEEEIDLGEAKSKEEILAVLVDKLVETE